MSDMRELTPIGCRIAGSKERRPVFLGPMSVLEIDGNCPPKIGEEVEEVIWSYLHPDERMQRERLGVVPIRSTVRGGPRRSPSSSS
jgi:hypothetical protein